MAFSLTVSVVGTDPTQGGLVTSSPAGIDCGATCSSSFSSGTSVTLAALASPTSVFAGWAGACVGTEPTCTLTMDANKAVSAIFISL